MCFDFSSTSLLLPQPAQQSSALIEELKLKELATASNMLLHMLNEHLAQLNGPLVDMPQTLNTQSVVPISEPHVTSTPSPLSPTTSTGTISPSTSSMDGSLEDDRRPHQCPECLKRFRFKSNLFEHRSLHQQSTPFVCPFCSKTCRLKGNLKKHLAVHVTSSEALEELWKARFSRSSGRPRKQPPTQHPNLHQQQLPTPMATYPLAIGCTTLPQSNVGLQQALLNFNSLTAFNRF